MGWITGIAVYVCVWWIVIFAVLPWGVRAGGPNSSGFDPGAPEKTYLPIKLLATTLISAVIWIVIYKLTSSDLISFRGSLPAGLS